MPRVRTNKPRADVHDTPEDDPKTRTSVHRTSGGLRTPRAGRSSKKMLSASKISNVAADFDTDSNGPRSGVDFDKEMMTVDTSEPAEVEPDSANASDEESDDFKTPPPFPDSDLLDTSTWGSWLGGKFSTTFLAQAVESAKNNVRFTSKGEAGNIKSTGTTSKEELEGGGSDEEDQDSNIDKGGLQEDIASLGNGGVESEDEPQENDSANDQPTADESKRNNKLPPQKTRSSKAKPGPSSGPENAQPKPTTRSTQPPKPTRSSKAAVTKKATSSRQNDTKLPDKQERLERICGYWYDTDGTLRLFIKWKGCPASENTWEPAIHLREYIPEEVDDYIKEIEQQESEQEKEKGRGRQGTSSTNAGGGEMKRKEVDTANANISKGKRTRRT